jgi:hypothetical protein
MKRNKMSQDEGRKVDRNKTKDKKEAKEEGFEIENKEK